MPSNSILNIKKDGEWVEIPAIVGSTPNLTIGTVETLPSGSDATATITGDKENPVLNLGIPNGDAGEKGEDGFSPSATVEKVDKIATITITDKNGTTTATIKDGEYVEGGEHEKCLARAKNTCFGIMEPPLDFHQV